MTTNPILDDLNARLSQFVIDFGKGVSGAFLDLDYSGSGPTVFWSGRTYIVEEEGRVDANRPIFPPDADFNASTASRAARGAGGYTIEDTEGGRFLNQRIADFQKFIVDLVAARDGGQISVVDYAGQLDEISVRLGFLPTKNTANELIDDFRV